MTTVVTVSFTAAPLAAETLRIATWHAPLSRRGPGLLLRDLLRGTDAELSAVESVIARHDPDILLLTNIDYDHGLVALGALRDRLGDRGAAYPHLLALRPNTGIPTGRDLDGDGRRGGARDAQGFGRFAGQGGMAVLSRLPVQADGLRDFSDLLWRDLPGSLIAPDDPGLDLQRLSSVGHWVVPLRLPSGQTLRITAFHATTPVFDGPEDRNGRRNHDEVRFWQHYLDGAFGPPPAGPLVVMGKANIDPARGDGRRGAIADLLADPRLSDPAPDTITVEWPKLVPMRVSYILPAAGLRVTAAGQSEPVGPHRMVWVDIAVTPP